MSDDGNGYRCYWMRVGRHVGLSDAAKRLGVRASELSAFERGGAHPLSAAQTAAYAALLQSIELPEAADPEPDAKPGGAGEG
ncbi:MAG: hypothetical protein ACR2OO_03575 [Thermomicrobiales bacterium]